MSRRCGFVAVLGAPNAGKSTLINQLVGTKVSIVSEKVQTTRNLVRGIVIHGDSQVVFIDTPGIFRPRKRLEKAMVAAAWQAEAEAEIIILLVDASRSKPGRETMDILDRLAADAGGRPCLLVLNKTDAADKGNLLTLAKTLNDRMNFAATFMVSALNGDGAHDVLAWLAANVREGDWMFPEDDVSDMPLRLLAAEITREKLFRALYQELPHALAVETEAWENFDDGSVKISQVIYVQRESHKAIVLGKGGAQIGAVGEAARLELEEIVGGRVHLKLFVKVQENWDEDPEKFRLWGLDYSA